MGSWVHSAWAASPMPEAPKNFGNAIISQAWIEKSDSDRAIHAIGGVTIKAPAKVIWSIMLDCDMAVVLADDIKDCEILESGTGENWDIRKQKVSVSSILPKFVTVFRSDYLPYSEIRISRVRGDLKIQAGLWKLEEATPESTIVTYQARLKPKGPVPKSLFRRAVDKDLPEILSKLKRAAEDRYATQKLQASR